jgi:hypothetical protein
MTLQEFAAQHRLKLSNKPEDGGVSQIVGKTGDIYEQSSSELGVCYMPGIKNGRGVGSWHPKIWNGFCRSAEAIGMTVRQRGDSEGALSFDPANQEQVKLALKIARVRPKRVVSPERAAILVANLAKSRSKGPKTTPLGA